MPNAHEDGIEEKEEVEKYISMNTVSVTHHDQLGLTPTAVPHAPVAASSTAVPILPNSSSSASSTSSSFLSPSFSDSILVGTSTQLIYGTTLLEMKDSSHLLLHNDHGANPSEGRENIRLLKHRLDTDGYLLLRGYLPLRKIRKARSCVCETIQREWPGRIDLSSNDGVAVNTTTSDDDDDTIASLTSTPLMRARILPCTDVSTSSSSSSTSSSTSAYSGFLLTGYRALTHDPAVLDLLEGEELATIFAKLFGAAIANANADSSSSSTVASSSPAPHVATSASSLPSPPPLISPSTFHTKWVRIHGRDEFTDEHSDYYRFEQWREGHEREERNEEEIGSNGMYTAWIPLGDYPIHHGTLVLAEGTHLLKGYQKRGEDGDAPNQEGMQDELPHDWEKWRDGTTSSSQGIWRTTHFHPGDLVIFDIRTIHASTRNQTNNFRISMDTRWKPSVMVAEEQKDGFSVMQEKVRR